MLKFNNIIMKFGNNWLNIPEPEPSDEVKIGNQIWKTKNLTIDDGEEGIVTQTVNYGQGDVIEYYYNYNAAARVASTINGWRLPTYEDLSALLSKLLGGDRAAVVLKSTYGWIEGGGNGQDSLGFGAFPAGFCYNGTLMGFGNQFNIWSSSPYPNSNNQRTFQIQSYARISNMYGVTHFLPIRLVKDVI